MRVLVAGCGYLGSALAARLATAGHDVAGVRRRKRPEAVPGAALDFTDPAATAGWLRGEPAFDAVVCCVAAGAGDRDAYRAAYVEALGGLQSALRDTHPDLPILLFTSSTSVYGHDTGEEVDEDSATEPRGFRGAIQLEAETLVGAWGGPHCSLRLGGIYGPGRTRLAESVRDGAARATRTYTNRIHRDDAAGALAHLLEHAAAARRLPPVLLGVDSAPALRSEVVAWLAERLGAPSPGESDPAERGKRCLNTRLLGLGYTLSYPSYREGYTAVLGADPRFPGFSAR